MNTSNRQFVGNPWVLTVLLLGLLQVCPLFAAGIVLTKKHSTESEAYWEPVEFVKIERFPTSVVIETRSKQSSSIPVYSIGTVVEFIDFTKATIVTSDHLEKLKTERGKVATVQAQCKRSEPLLAPVVNAYDTVLRECANGNVLLGGKWVNRQEFEARQRDEAMKAKSGTMPILEVGARSYQEVRVTKIVEGRITFIHAGGVGSVPQSDLSAETLSKVQAAFPLPFELAKKEAETKQKAVDAPREVAAEKGGDPTMPPSAIPGGGPPPIQSTATPETTPDFARYAKEYSKFPQRDLCRLVGRQSPDLIDYLKREIFKIGVLLPNEAAEYAVGLIEMERDSVRLDAQAFFKETGRVYEQRSLKECIDIFVNDGFTPVSGHLYGLMAILMRSQVSIDKKEEGARLIGKCLAVYHEKAKTQDVRFWRLLAQNRADGQK